MFIRDGITCCIILYAHALPTCPTPAMVILLMLFFLSIQRCSVNFSCVVLFILNSECEEDFKLFNLRTKKQNVTKLMVGGWVEIISKVLKELLFEEI